MPAGVAATIKAVSGGGQVAYANQAFGLPLVVQVLDSNGNPVSGATVTFVVNPDPTTGAFGTIAGGYTAVTNGSGVATSGTITANSPSGPGVKGGNFTISAWTPSQQAGAVGPAMFGFAIVQQGVILNSSAIATAWTTSKTHQSQLQTDIAAVITDLANLEADRDLFWSLGAGDVSDWLQKFISTLRLGYQPRLSASGGPSAQIVQLQAPNPNITRDTTAAVQPLISQTTSGQICGLT